MEPVLKGWPQKKRNLWFGPFVILGFVAGFIASAVPTAEFVVGLLVGPIIGVAVAYVLVGWPRFTTRSGKPLITATTKPWLFFLVFPVTAAAVYVILGVFLTPVLPPDWLAWASLALAVVTAFAAAWIITGLPPVVTTVRTQWARVPESTRPWLFFPFSALFALILYFAVGVVVTRTPIPLSWYPFVVLPAAIVLGVVLAYVIVGIPRPAKPVAEYVPDVPGRLRPPVFLVTFLVLGVPFSYLAGLAWGFVPGVTENMLLPLAFLVGYAFSLGAAAAAWGTPRSWAERFPDYKPGLPEGARVALFLPVVVAVTVACAIAANIAGLELFWGLVAGVMLGVLVALKATGAFKRLREFRGDAPTFLPELPDKVKPLVLFPVWFLVGGFVYVMLTFPSPGTSAWNAAAGAAVGLVVAVLLVEEPTFRELLEHRRARRERRAAWKRERKEALQTARAPQEDA